MNDIIFNWLKTFPGLELLQRQQVDAVPGGSGLFFRGIAVKDRKWDLLGGLRCRKELRFRISRYGGREESALFFLMLAAWAEENAPHLGDDQVLALEEARCVRDSDQGLSLWESELTITYTEEAL